MYRSLLIALRISMATALVAGLVGSQYQPAAAAHRFYVKNRGEHTISEVHISGLSQTTYGPDLLGNQYIEPGQDKAFNLVQGCVQDILIVWDDGEREKDNRWNTCTYNVITNY